MKSWLGLQNQWNISLDLFEGIYVLINIYINAKEEYILVYKQDELRKQIDLEYTFKSHFL